MDGISLRPLEPEHLAEAEKWIDTTAADILLKTPRFPARYHKQGQYPVGVVAIADNRPVGLAIISPDDEHVGTLNFVVKTSERRQGIGGYLVESILELQPVLNLRKLQAFVEPDNIAGQKILEKNDFVRIGFDTEGNILFEKL